MNNFNLRENILKKFCEDISKKKVLAIKEEELVEEFLTYIQVHSECMKKLNAYEMSSVIRSFYTWYLSKDKEPNSKHKAQHRDVYYIDLGAYNLKYESGFIHPCIIIKRYGSNVLVVPCSSKKYEKNDELIFDIKKGKPFRENTGVLLDQIRSVSVTRMKACMGRVEPEIFEELTNQIIRKYFCKKDFEFNSLESKVRKLENEISKKDARILELENKLKNMKVSE